MKKLVVVTILETTVSSVVGEEDTMKKNVSSTVDEAYNEIYNCMDAGDSKSPFYKKEYYNEANECYELSDIDMWIRLYRYDDSGEILREKLRCEFFSEYEKYKRRKERERREYEEYRKKEEIRQKEEREEIERRLGPGIPIEELFKSLCTSNAARLNEEAYGKPCNYNEDDDDTF